MNYSRKAPKVLVDLHKVMGDSELRTLLGKLVSSEHTYRMKDVWESLENKHPETKLKQLQGEIEALERRDALHEEESRRLKELKKKYEKAFRSVKRKKPTLEDHQPSHTETFGGKRTYASGSFAHWERRFLDMVKDSMTVTETDEWTPKQKEEHLLLIREKAQELAGLLEDSPWLYDLAPPCGNAVFVDALHYLADKAREQSKIPVIVGRKTERSSMTAMIRKLNALLRREYGQNVKDIVPIIVGTANTVFDRRGESQITKEHVSNCLR